ncbi:MAG: Gfo/Idh/MocA family oxidoreductase [Syntrophobacterales bacterium]|nr:MAG: Gfo/Idh/MocA family oxidoreductase [Syntrophobacterales bacterium]
MRVGVIGIGHLGTYHLQKYEKLPHCRIIGVSDKEKERAIEAAERYRCASFSDHRELLDKVDVVSITVPTISHHAIARDFLREGVDVLLEKPMTLTLDEADDIISIAEDRGAILQIGFVERFNPAIVALKKVIGAPLFIESHRLHPFLSRGTDVDVILDLMIHDLDIIIDMVKSPVITLDAVGVSVLSEKVDIANVRITFESGCVANITASRVTNKMMQKIRLFEGNGYHSVDFAKRELISLGRKTIGGTGMEIRENQTDVVMTDPLEEEIRAFIDSVATRQPPLVSGREGRKSLELALRIVEKIEERKGFL